MSTIIDTARYVATAVKICRKFSSANQPLQCLSASTSSTATNHQDWQSFPLLHVDVFSVSSIDLG